MGSFSMISGDPHPALASTGPAVATSSNIAGCKRRRRISPQAGRALEILGHAIEYLSDEYVHAGGSLAAHDPQLEAVQMLMAANRQIYFACPEVPTLAERWHALLHPRTA